MTEEVRNSRLRPQLKMFDAVATGLAAILGAGIFAVIAWLVVSNLRSACQHDSEREGVLGSVPFGGAE